MKQGLCRRCESWSKWQILEYNISIGRNAVGVILEDKVALGILPSRPKFTEPMDWQDLIIYIKNKIGFMFSSSSAQSFFNCRTSRRCPGTSGARSGASSSWWDPVRRPERRSPVRGRSTSGPSERWRWPSGWRGQDPPEDRIELL